MSIFSSKFDLVTEESFAAPGAVAVMLDVARSGASYDSNGTWKPGGITAGTIVTMDPAGKAVKAEHGTVTSGALVGAPKLVLVVIDGTDTFSGAFTSKVTCLASGFQMKTDQFASGVYAVGAPVSFGSGANAGKVVAWEAGRQILGFVGKDGLTDGQLHVIVLPRF